MSVADETTDRGRTKTLKAGTHARHQSLDEAIMAHRLFDSRERYAAFVQIQALFHREIDPLYRMAELIRFLPDLPTRRRLPLIDQDLADLGAAPLHPVVPSSLGPGIGTALGWLYVAEGSHLGAAFLSKEAAKLGLSGTFGARHLAAPPEGRGLHWRTFASALDALRLSEAEEAAALLGALSAFAHVRAIVEAVTERLVRAS